VIVELCIDTDNIRDLQEKNHKLKLENEALRKKSKHEVIEIIDNRKKNDEIQFGGF
jgi:regulator of replication initiation timing